MTDPRSICRISPQAAQDKLAAGMHRLLTATGRSFTNPEAESLCLDFGIGSGQAGHDIKADIVVLEGGAREPDAFFAQSVTAGRSSFSNASGRTRYTFSIVYADGELLIPHDRSWVLREFGKGTKDGLRKIVSKLQARGLVLRRHSIKSKEFLDDLKDAGIDADELGCLCLHYLHAPFRMKDAGAISNVLNLHAVCLNNDQRRIRRTTEGFLRYIHNRIIRGKDNEDYPCTGMVFIERDGCRVIKADGALWWQKQIKANGAFDTADPRNGDGYAYPGDDGVILFDYAILVRGTFKSLLDDAQSTLF